MKEKDFENLVLDYILKKYDPNLIEEEGIFIQKGENGEDLCLSSVKLLEILEKDKNKPKKLARKVALEIQKQSLDKKGSLHILTHMPHLDKKFNQLIEMAFNIDKKEEVIFFIQIIYDISQEPVLYDGKYYRAFSID